MTKGLHQYSTSVCYTDRDKRNSTYLKRCRDISTPSLRRRKRVERTKVNRTDSDTRRKNSEKQNKIDDITRRVGVALFTKICENQT
jgi:hypothetical protein